MCNLKIMFPTSGVESPSCTVLQRKLNLVVEITIFVITENWDLFLPSYFF